MIKYNIKGVCVCGGGGAVYFPVYILEHDLQFTRRFLLLVCKVADSFMCPEKQPMLSRAFKVNVLLNFLYNTIFKCSCLGNLDGPDFFKGH